MTEKKYPRMNSYPMALREVVTPVIPNFLKEYATRTMKSPMNSEDRLKQREKLLTTPWGHLKATE